MTRKPQNKLPSMPLFVDDFEAATAHLTLEEDGAYNRLLRLCWRTPGCSIPDDEVWIKRHMRADQDAFDRVIGPIIEEFFRRDKGRLFQKRQQQEFSYVSNLTSVRKLAGSKGGRRKALKEKETESSNATDLAEQNGSSAVAPIPIPIPTPISTDPDGSVPRDSGKKIEINGQAPLFDDEQVYRPSRVLMNLGKEQGLSEIYIQALAEDMVRHYRQRGESLDDPDKVFRAWLMNEGRREREREEYAEARRKPKTGIMNDPQVKSILARRKAKAGGPD